MTSHVLHADVHEVGLQDGCPRCEEHATHPYHSLDERMIEELERRVEDLEPPRSKAEALALEHVRAMVWP
jgi:hypothetical protein